MKVLSLISATPISLGLNSLSKKVGTYKLPTCMACTIKTVDQQLQYKASMDSTSSRTSRKERGLQGSFIWHLIVNPSWSWDSCRWPCWHVQSCTSLQSPEKRNLDSWTPSAMLQVLLLLYRSTCTYSFTVRWLILFSELCESPTNTQAER